MSYSDPIERIYRHAEALRTLAANLPETMGGLSLLLSLLATDLHTCGDTLERQEQLPASNRT
ncbi:hypothetical protein [Oleidesulfovibrio alaskensis]|jgi:hypothetical protein|uniref:hypothetical protein n=1 Tax=Oleidesulfovibrio alaskensis TaxID=58180 RepID=UPI000412401B|nr:hypothetical protein [Oleidesulfovibrio alaskensis]